MSISRIGKNVLIISYTFPPGKGIGGRRWSKFTKHFSRNGIDVHVLAAKLSGTGVSDWDKDISDYRHKVTYLKTNYPDVLNGKPTTIIQKINYRFMLAWIRLLTRGNYYDKSICWGKELISFVEKSITSGGIKNVIVSCAPFHMAYALLDLKRRYTGVNFIVDFRDPWTNGKAYGFPMLSSKRMTVEKKKELEVIQGYDYVISVADEMTTYFNALHPYPSSKFRTIKNGFDPEDYGSGNEHKDDEEQNRSSEQDILKFVFTGSFYSGAIHHFNGLVDALNEIRHTHQDIYTKLRFEFYGDLPRELKIASKAHSNIYTGDFISLAEVFRKIRNADACMLFLTDEVNYSFSTKFYEYLSQRKTIAVFTKEGPTSGYIKEHQLGYTLIPGNLKQELIRMYNDFLNGTLVQNPDYSYKEHEVGSIALHIQELLID